MRRDHVVEMGLGWEGYSALVGQCLKYRVRQMLAKVDAEIDMKLVVRIWGVGGRLTDR